MSRWSLALGSQLGGLAVISFVVYWGGMIWMKLIPISAILVAIIIYTLVPFFWLDGVCKKWPHFILGCRNVFRRITAMKPLKCTYTPSDQDSQYLYIGILAFCDLVVLCFLMFFSNGLKSPFSPFLLTVPAVVFLLDFPFTRASILVFLPMLFVVLLNYFNEIYPFVTSLASPFPSFCFLVVTIVCVVVVFIQAWFEFERSYEKGEGK